jgi:hypothetical protein
MGGVIGTERKCVSAPDGDAHEKLIPLTTDVPLNTLDHFSIRPHAQRWGIASRTEQ